MYIILFAIDHTVQWLDQYFQEKGIKSFTIHNSVRGKMETILKELEQAIIKLNETNAESAAQKAVDSNMDLSLAISDGLMKGMAYVGDKFRNGEFYLPEIVMASEAFSSAMKIIDKAMLAAGVSKEVVGTVVIGTVQGDLHNIGKDMVAMLMQTAGFKVIDLGIDVKSSAFVQAVQEANADIVAASALLTTTMDYQRELLEFLKEANIRDQVFYMIGGAPITQTWADEIGADFYGKNAQDAVDASLVYVSKKKGLNK
jgi:corrinoid protein of di/trimethylamine methyltransferase